MNKDEEEDTFNMLRRISYEELKHRLYKSYTFCSSLQSRKIIIDSYWTPEAFDEKDRESYARYGLYYSDNPLGSIYTYLV